jgi:hypothetical protein
MQDEGKIEGKRVCLFCPNPADSHEHIIAECLTRRAGRTGQIIHVGYFHELKGLDERPPTTPRKFKTRQVCEACNNGWMSNLEGWMNDRVGHLIEPHWPNWAETAFLQIRDDPIKLVRWMIKTAILFECATRRGERTVLPEDVFTMAREARLTQDLFVMVAHIKDSGYKAQLFKGYPTETGGRREKYQVHPNGFSFALQINHLALRIIRCPDAVPNVFVPKNSNFASNIAAPFFVYGRVGQYSLPIHYSFDNFTLFDRSIIVVVG